MVEIKPFVLHMFPAEEAYLCPVRALADWLAASRITSGYVFRKMTSDGRPVANDTAMVSLHNLLCFSPPSHTDMYPLHTDI